MAPHILVSAGEASGDRYAARLVEALRARLPGAEFFGCTGPELRAAGVRQVVDMASLAVVGIAEVVRHIPRIYGEYRRIVAAAKSERPRLAILTDSPDFHLRLAARLRRLGIPVVYLVAPQVWAWRKGRLKTIRRNVSQLHCIFPFEEGYFQSYGVPATYIGHPLARLAQPRWSRTEFLRRHRVPEDRPVITVCPGSRAGELARHLPLVAGAAREIHAARGATLLLALPQQTTSHLGAGFVAAHTGEAPLRMIEGETWDALAHCDVALTASGTVTLEAGLLGAPTVTFYRVSPLTYLVGRRLVDVPFYSMVNLVAGEAVIPELIQHEATAPRLAREVLRLLDDRGARDTMRARLAGLRDLLATGHDPLEYSAGLIAARLERN